MSHRLSQNARHTNDLLEELERDKELEVLRDYLTRFGLFPRTRDPASAPIRFEELKELVKHWKLHRQRNFWKTHTTKEDLVRTLYRHINTKIIPQENREDGNGSAGNAGGGAAGVTTTSTAAMASGGSATIAAAPPPPRKASIPNGGMGHGLVDSPRSRSILNGLRANGDGPKRENIFTEYKGDLFSQRGDYQDGMIYLSRFRKPSNIEVTNSTVSLTDNNQDLAQEPDEMVQEKLMDSLDARRMLSREVRLKQECSFSLYHFTTIAGNEERMIGEGSMLALSRLSIYDDVEVKRFCAAAILNLSCELALCSRMIDEGVLLALLELAKAQQEEVRRNTSMALCRFSYERAGQLRLVQEGCVSAIISMLNSSDTETKEACVKALINIASYSGSAVAESVVQTVVKISTKKEPCFISFAAEAIYNLSLLAAPRAKVVDDGILDNICELAQSATVETDVKTHLAIALCNFSGIPSNLEALSQVRILECIEDLLKVDNERVREMCAVAVANMSSQPASLRNLVLSDAAVQLVELGREASRVIEENTALSLSNMAATPDSRPLLSRFGVVALLLHFLEQGSPLTKQYAIVALCHLMSNPSTCAELMQSNIPEVLARLSSSVDDKVRELCANALCNLSCNQTLHSFLLKDDVIRAIVRLCKSHHVNADGELEVEEAPPTPANTKAPVALQPSQECAIGCLYNLSFLPESRKILIRVDLVKTLFGIFQRPMKNEDLVKQCAAIVANLTFETESRVRIVDDDGVRLLRKLMRSSSKDTLLCCSTACCNLAAEGLEKTQLLTMLIELSASPHTMITLNCAIAFAKLASNAAHRPLLTKCAELYPALTLMMRCGIEDIQIYSAVTLCNLAIERPQRTRHIWKEGTVPDFIVNSLLRINSDSTKEICARALFNLLTHSEHRMAHIKDGVLYALVKLARLESVEIRSLCVTALYNLSCDPAMIEMLMEINVAQVVTKMCEIEFSNQEIHRRLAACLANLAMKPGTELRLVESGALVAILVLAEHGDPPTMSYCASVLCYLSTQRSNCEAMAANNLIDVLARVIASDDEQQNEFALNALCNISQVPTLHDRIGESGATTHVLRLLRHSERVELALASAKTLYNLTFHPPVRRALLEKDLVGVLLARLSRDPVSSSVVTVAVQILSILCEEESDWPSLIQSGAVKVLRLMAPHCQHEAMGFSVYALSQLARADGETLRVLSEGALDVVAAAMAVECHDDEVVTLLARRCSVILRTLSTSSECLEPLIADQRLVPVAMTATANGDAETCKNCILALYNITSGHSASLGGLMQAGVVKLLIQLARVGGAELAPICAMSLAHLKHTLKDREPANGADGADSAALPDEMEDGIVVTLLAMIDLDPASIQKLDRQALALPTNPPSARPTEWVFLAGSVVVVVDDALPVTWAFLSSPIDDARFVPPEPKSFLLLLVPVLPVTGVTVQDKLYGAFQVMTVSPAKFRIKRVDPRFLRSVADGDGDGGDGASGDAPESLAEAISAALSDDAMALGRQRASQSGGSSKTETQAEAEAGEPGIDTGDETRAPSPVKKKPTFRSLARAASNRALNEQLTRRNSKGSGHKVTKPVPEPRAAHRSSSQRKSTAPGPSSASSDGSDRGVVLPRL